MLSLPLREVLVRPLDAPVSFSLNSREHSSAECQMADWKTHKKYCKEFGKQRVGFIQSKLDEITVMARRKEEEEKKAGKRPDRKVCTGCNVRFRRDYPIDQECPDCGYVACESCSCHHSRGQ